MTGQEEREEKRIAKRLKEVADAARLPPSPGGDPTQAAAAAGSGATPHTAKVLDVGCGDGTLMPYLLGETSMAGKKQKKQTKGGEGIKSVGETAPQSESEEKGAG